jgi:hypothetical protein
MVNQRIIYQNSSGGVSVVIPAPEFMETHSIDDLVKCTVPTGAKYKIVSVDNIPSDRTFRGAWEYQE